MDAPDLSFLPEQQEIGRLGPAAVLVKTYYRGCNHSLLQLGEASFRSRVDSILSVMRATVAFAPNPGFNARVIGKNLLTQRISLGNNCLLRNKEHPADGLLIEKSDVVVMSLGGCGILCLYNESTGKCVVLHCAQRSLINLSPIESREYESIIGAGIAAIGTSDRSVVHAFGMNFIPPDAHFHPFNHLQYDNHLLHRKLSGTYGNDVAQKVDRDGFPGVQVDLALLAVRQLIHVGVPEKQINIFPPLPTSLPHTHLPKDDKRRTHTYLATIRFLG